MDGLDINQPSQHLATAWPFIREQLLAGTYRPSPVRRVSNVLIALVIVAPSRRAMALCVIVVRASALRAN